MDKNLLRIKTTRAEFEAASSNGDVYGELVLLDGKKPKKNYPVYAELGNEQNYRESPKDDPKTSYRFFVKCKVFLGESFELLEQGTILLEINNVSVVIYS